MITLSGEETLPVSICLSSQALSFLNPIALITPKSFGHSECNRVKKDLLSKILVKNSLFVENGGKVWRCSYSPYSKSTLSISYLPMTFIQVMLPYFFDYKTEFFSSQNNPKDLYPSCKMDLDLKDCLGRVKIGIIAKFHRTDLVI